MTTDTLTLTAFLLERIEEDEARAEPTYVSYSMDVVPGQSYTIAAGPIPWICPAGVDSVDVQVGERDQRILAECAAKRAIIDAYENGDPSELYVVICALAAVYADHPDYRADWAL